MENTLVQTTVNAIKDWKAVQKELGSDYCFFNHLMCIKSDQHLVKGYLLIDVYFCYIERERIAKQQAEKRKEEEDKDKPAIEYGVNKYGMLTDTSLQVNENA